MKYKTPAFIFGFLAFFIFRILISGACLGERAKVYRFIVKGKSAVESKDILSCAGMISADYQDKYGYDRQSLIFSLREFFNYYGRISIKIQNFKISIDDDKMNADVEINALVLAHSGARELKKTLGVERGRLKARLVKEEGKWKLSEIEFYESVKITDEAMS